MITTTLNSTDSKTTLVLGAAAKAVGHAAAEVSVVALSFGFTTAVIGGLLGVVLGLRGGYAYGFHAAVQSVLVFATFSVLLAIAAFARFAAESGLVNPASVRFLQDVNAADDAACKRNGLEGIVSVLMTVVTGFPVFAVAVRVAMIVKGLVTLKALRAGASVAEFRTSFELGSNARQAAEILVARHYASR